MNDFSIAVGDKDYNKLDYSVWRTLNRMQGKLFIIWSYPSATRTAQIDICEKSAGDTAPLCVHLYANDDSFGEFLHDKLLVCIEEYSQYGSFQNVTPTVSPHDVNDWGVELNQTVETNRISETINKLCESATLTAPVNNNHIKKENNTMKFNFDFGPVNPSMVRMSLYGLAVKNKTGTWVSYNSNSDEIVDVDVLNFDGAKFLYRMPVAIKDIAVGDVVIHNSAPMFVVFVPQDGKTLTVVDTINGERKDIMLPRSPFGFNFATKVVNFLGNMMTGATAENPFGNMWMLMAMSGDNKDMSDILPLMMLSGANGGTMDSNMLMFMALSGDNKDMLPWLMMSQSMNAAPAHTCACGGNCGKNPEQN